MTTIGTEICPACGRVVWLVRLPAGPAYFHGAYGDSLCLGESFVRAGDAEAVRRIRERGGERLRLAAHP
ncbi:hypothetical protein ABTY20_18935 [Streptomyces sp. NPDC126497]|uniref:hypothetical protein n=1 Tax=Streptomyces sp. NPDC126497 TaxID=3155313 RepID=UPI003329AC05